MGVSPKWVKSNTWDTLKVETLNQKIGRMILGVHKKSSRLAVLGELGRYPLMVKGLCNTLKYHAHLCKVNGSDSLLGMAVTEMSLTNDPNLTSWWGRVNKLKEVIGINYSTNSKIETIGQKIKQGLKSKF